MEVVYCDNCGSKITEDVVYGDDGHVYCYKCAPLFKFKNIGLQKIQPPCQVLHAVGENSRVRSTGAEQSVTKFYFCETCGKRITDQQILEGLGRNKKLKGVYCSDSLSA